MSKILKTTADFDNAILFQSTIQVWMKGQLVVYRGIIEKHTSEAVRVEGRFYLKSVYEFRVK